MSSILVDWSKYFTILICRNLRHSVDKKLFVSQGRQQSARTSFPCTLFSFLTFHRTQRHAASSNGSKRQIRSQRQAQTYGRTDTHQGRGAYTQSTPDVKDLYTNRPTPRDKVDCFNTFLDTAAQELQAQTRAQNSILYWIQIFTAGLIQYKMGQVGEETASIVEVCALTVNFTIFYCFLGATEAHSVVIKLGFCSRKQLL